MKTQRDAGTAIANLVTQGEPKRVFLNNSSALNQLLRTGRSSHASVRQVAARFLLNFCTIEAAKQAVVSPLGLSTLALLLRDTDDVVQRRAVQVNIQFVFPSC